MKLKEKMTLFCKSFIILLFIYLLCPTHDVRQGSGSVSRITGFCATSFYIIFLSAFIIIFFLY
jgi:hypothetical protein